MPGKEKVTICSHLELKWCAYHVEPHTAPLDSLCCQEQLTLLHPYRFGVGGSLLEKPGCLCLRYFPFKFSILLLVILVISERSTIRSFLPCSMVIE